MINEVLRSFLFFATQSLPYESRKVKLIHQHWVTWSECSKFSASELLNNRLACRARWIFEYWPMSSSQDRICAIDRLTRFFSKLLMILDCEIKPPGKLKVFCVFFCWTKCKFDVRVHAGAKPKRHWFMDTVERTRKMSDVTKSLWQKLRRLKNLFFCFPWHHESSVKTIRLFESDSDSTVQVESVLNSKAAECWIAQI